MGVRVAVGRRGGPAVVLMVLCALLVGCSVAGPSSGPSAQGAAPPAGAASESAPQHGPGSPGGGLDMPSVVAPADLALQLEALLGQHSVLVADMMRGRIREDEDFGQAANAAVGRNTDELAAVLGSLIGQQGADEFHRLWAKHVAAFFSYSRGLATNDAAARDEARAQLIEYENEVAEFFSAASQGRLPREGARAAAQAHVGHLLDQADAYAAGDYARADELYRESYNHLFGAGHALAAAVVAPAQAAALEQPSWRLRSELQRLLGEHVALTVAALRAGATNSPDFPAAGQALNANTRDLAAAVGTLFGAPAGQQFMTLWADHVDQLVAYTAGVAANDEGRREAALSRLSELENQLAGFFGSATGNTSSSPNLAQAFLAHNEMLTRQVDAFVGKDYLQTHELAGDAYQGMFGLSGQLADAVGGSVAARLPQGGAETGAGGTAGAPGTR